VTKPRQAVVIIHGIGEQRPMETLRSFVLGVLGSTQRPNGTRAFYSKPDPNADTFELRRYRAFQGRTDSDFIEFYWQHLMPVAAWRFLFIWLWLLMKRPVKSMPPRFVSLWWVAWIAFILVALAILASVLSWVGIDVPQMPLATKLPWGAAVIGASVGFLVRAFVGDAAVYLNPHPRTVQARNAIRSSGVALIERLQFDGRYDRIVVVGHSLGSVIGYDILSFAWHRASEEFRRKVEAGGLPADTPSQSALAAAEKLAKTGGPNLNQQWQTASRAVAVEFTQLGLKWLVTDFVTLGSPLAHGSLLLAHGPADFTRRVGERELPVSPPFREDGTHFSYQRAGRSSGGKRQSARVPDHAAVFALTTWTNLYFPCRAFFYGDVIGGSIAASFGPAIADRAVATKIRKGWLAHTSYWSRYSGFDNNSDSAPVGLIDALDLDRQSFPRRAPVQRKPAAKRADKPSK